MWQRLLLTAVCAALLIPLNSAACPEPRELDDSLIVMNLTGPLISSRLAGDIALAFLQARSQGIFEAKGAAEIADVGDRWRVTFENALFEPPIDLTKRFQVKELRVGDLQVQRRYCPRRVTCEITLRGSTTAAARPLQIAPFGQFQTFGKMTQTSHWWTSIVALYSTCLPKATALKNA